MAGVIKKVLRFSIIAITAPVVAFAAQQVNPRNSGVANKTTARTQESASNAAVRRSAASVVARSVSESVRKNRPVVTARSGVARTATVRSARSAVTGANVSRVATKSSLARSGKKQKLNSANISRAGTARATAVFNDVSKIGGGYADCRDSYATCMDQFCANANDTYRRCFCSDKFTTFRDTADKLDTALQMLADFQNNNLNAVDKSAAEVNAMYTASAGEEAIKRDTSASQKLLDSIGDVLSGKSSTPAKQSTGSLGILDFSAFSGFDGDIFGSGASDLFGGTASPDMSTLEGKALYDNATKQCAQITQNACGSEAMFNLARSAYSIMITQDCNAYEKNIDAKKASVEETVRTAEKYLREARLEDYRAHNSADVNECLSKVESAIRQPTACGEKYEKCLDYSGLYINSVTGEPIYSKALFDLNNLIILNGSADVLAANPKFNDFLESKKMFVTPALDTCRDIADVVWQEFKRGALIQISQAQDDKIEEVKDSCVETMKECYDTQTGALESFADTTGSSTGAISAITAHDMCQDKVLACAALYGDPDGCVYDDKSKKLKQVDGKKCGLDSLLAFVNTVDAVKVAKGCEESLREYAQELCAPSSGDTEHSYPWGCRSRAFGTATDSATDGSIYGMLNQRAKDFCGDELMNTTNEITQESDWKPTIAASANSVKKIMDDIKADMSLMLATECRSITTDGNAVWDENGYTVGSDLIVNVSPTWLKKIYGNNADLQSLVNSGVRGYNLEVAGGRAIAASATYENSRSAISRALEKMSAMKKMPSIQNNLLTQIREDASVKSTEISSSSQNTGKSFGWGVCMLPTLSQYCTMQDQLPGMKGTTEYQNGECVLTNNWYIKKCESIGGYWSGDNCYIK